MNELHYVYNTNQTIYYNIIVLKLLLLVQICINLYLLYAYIYTHTNTYVVLYVITYSLKRVKNIYIIKFILQ